METLFQNVPTGFADLWILQPRYFEDARGSFVKTYHLPTFQALGISFEPREEFYSVSRRNVLRGMHFQSPPEAHGKLVYCVRGSVLDVVLDMRKNAATFGKSFAVELDAHNRKLLFIPVGFAHGFLSLAEDSVMVYKTDTVYVPTLDAGVAWDSFGFPWPVKAPHLSERDQAFVRWEAFQSPF